ncbi:hypothetical protein KAU43_05175 [candidate division WOR-3 bacterium]|nr:hypothetical protein [candidate division WOR-3 bacterium]
MKSSVIIILIYIMFIIIPKGLMSFEPEIHQYYSVSKRSSSDTEVTPEGIKNAIYGSKFELDKKKYICGEPILYKILVYPKNNYNGWADFKLKFTLKGNNVNINSKNISCHSRLFKDHRIKRYIYLPSSGGNIFTPKLKYKHYTVVTTYSYSNIFTYFDYVDSLIQVDIKPGEYILEAEFTKTNDKFSTILPSSIRFNIDTIPDNEKGVFKLLKLRKYDEIIEKHPNSIYAPYSSFKALIDKIYRYYRLSKNNRRKKYREDIKNRLYYGVKNYPEYYAGEVEVVRGIFRDVIFFSFMDTLITKNTENYFDKYRNLKDNKMAQFMVRRWINKYEYLIKWDKEIKERMERRKEERLKNAWGEYQ